MRRTQGRRRGGGRVVEVNITSLVDIAFVLLLVFILIAPAMQSGVEIELPQATASAISTSEKSLWLHVDQEGNLYLQDSRHAVSNLREALQSPNLPRGVPAFVRADTGVDYGVVLAALAELTQAGYTSVSLVSEPRP